MITIGKLSEATGVKIPTIRYYEQIGLLAEPGRSGSTIEHCKSGWRSGWKRGGQQAARLCPQKARQPLGEVAVEAHLHAEPRDLGVKGRKPQIFDRRPLPRSPDVTSGR